MKMLNIPSFFLKEKTILTNCSVYSLTSGSIQFEYTNNASWSPNFTEKVLPAFYITNCSIINLIDSISKINETSSHYASLVASPYNKRDNGDTFVALLFTISGSCVSCWMLSLLLYLSPKHKRKPWLTQLATVFYSIVTTILLSQITDIASDEYYNDTLDIIRFQSSIYNDDTYGITIIFSQLFTLLASLQIVIHVTRQKFKWYTGITGSIIILAYLVVDGIFGIQYNDSSAIFDADLGLPYSNWRITTIVLKLVIMIWFGTSLLYYTTMIKNPKKICYSKRLLMLGSFNWFLFLFHIVINILSTSMFRENWLVNIWFQLLPYLVEIILLTTVWEWVYNIEFLEKRFEIMGVLGRRISIDDVLNFHLRGDDHSQQRKNRLLQYFYSLCNKFSGSKNDMTRIESYNSNISQNKAKDFSISSNGSNIDRLVVQSATENASFDMTLPVPSTRNTNGNNERNEDNEDNEDNGNTESVNALNSDFNYAITTSTDNVTEIVARQEVENDNIYPTSSIGSDEVQYVDNYEFFDDEIPQEGNSHPPHPDDSPPPFQPHPGFNHGDYWPEDKG